MSNIPEAREIIAQVHDTLLSMGLAADAARLSQALRLLVRRPYAREKAPARSAWVDASLAAEIRKMARTYPNMPQQKIAEAFGVNAGRVSEALQGDR